MVLVLKMLLEWIKAHHLLPCPFLSFENHILRSANISIVIKTWHIKKRKTIKSDLKGWGNSCLLELKEEWQIPWGEWTMFHIQWELLECREHRTVQRSSSLGAATGL